MAATLLKVKGLKVAYGVIQAVKGIDFEVREGELVTLIGSNGAGKTTTMKAITGTLGINVGDIEYMGKSIKGQGPWDLVKQGLAMVPEGRGVFARMTIAENIGPDLDWPSRNALYREPPPVDGREDVLDVNALARKAGNRQDR